MRFCLEVVGNKNKAMVTKVGKEQAKVVPTDTISCPGFKTYTDKGIEFDIKSTFDPTGYSRLHKQTNEIHRHVNQQGRTRTTSE
jgi:hypothetical protein